MDKIKEYGFKEFVYNTLVNTKEYTELTDIQKEVVPLALKNKNIIQSCIFWPRDFS